MIRPERSNPMIRNLMGVPLVASMMALACNTAPQPFPVVGPGLEGNDPPTLTFVEPSASTTVPQGNNMLVRWNDSDRDDNARIDFSLVHTVTNASILLAENVEENDTTGPDRLTIPTDLVPTGTYNLLAEISDGTNPVVEVFATTATEGPERRLVVTIVEPGEGPQETPPQISVTQPAFNLSVSQEDVLVVAVQPTALPPAADRPFSPDNEISLFLVLDRDQNPDNDDPANPGSQGIIVLEARTIAAGVFDEQVFNVTIDLSQVPALPNGDPYFIRVTALDEINPPVHQYAAGTINVVQLAAGLVDLFDIGRTKSGARIYGFSPGANLGSTISGVDDFDVDGTADFVIVSQFGNARNVGPVGEAYLLYGTPATRLGGAISANSISETLSGVIFEAPPIRFTSFSLFSNNARTDGITDVSFLPDQNADGRPELIFGLPHTHGAFESMDFDPEDGDVTNEQVTVELAVRQSRVTVTEAQSDEVPISLTYSGVVETTINSATPDIPAGSSDSITWRDGGAGDREWTLIKFVDVLDLMPDTAEEIDISSVGATLELRIFDSGPTGNVSQLITDFTEQTTFNTFAGGNEPAADVDFVVPALGTITAQESGTSTVDVSGVVQELIDRQLTAFNNELRFIIASSASDNMNARARSSEFGIGSQRPLLRINYTREAIGGALGCYPDFLVNNRTDQEAIDRQFTAGGMAVIVDSDNRDNDPRIRGATRLDTTAIALELVGQESDVLSAAGLDRTGNILPRADAEGENGRIAGSRFMSGHFDFEDHLVLSQPARDGLFGQNVASIGDLNNDNLAEIVVSAPNNEQHLRDLLDTFGLLSTHRASTLFSGSIAVIPGGDYSGDDWREDAGGTNSIPLLDQQFFPPFGQCTNPREARDMVIPVDIFQVFAEDISDMLGGGQSAGDFNQDGLEDLLCGAYLNDRVGADDAGAAYVLYGRNILGNFELANADDPLLRAPMLRIRGELPNDQIGWRQSTGLDVNGDRLSDVFIGSPRTDFGDVVRSTCGSDFDGDGSFDNADLRLSDFNSCQNSVGSQVFTDDACKVFDYDNDEDIDTDDRCIFDCLSGEDPDDSCVLGLDPDDCCANLVDNGFVGIVFGGVFTDGDREISQIATSDLPGTIFFGAASGHRAGVDVSSAGDFNQDGFGDILIAVPGETRLDSAGRERLGVVYLIFGGTHLQNTVWNLASVGSQDLPGIVFLSPYVKGRPNEAAPNSVAFIGDINDDGFGDIAIGNPKADFIDLSFPQGPNATDADAGRRSDAGDAYIVYGNNFGSNRGSP